MSERSVSRNNPFSKLHGVHIGMYAMSNGAFPEIRHYTIGSDDYIKINFPQDLTKAFFCCIFVDITYYLKLNMEDINLYKHLYPTLKKYNITTIYLTDSCKS